MRAISSAAWSSRPASSPSSSFSRVCAHQRDRLVEERERTVVERGATHAQPVEHVLEVVRELADAVEPEHAREALQRVRGAEQPVHQLRDRRRAPSPAPVGEVAEVVAHPLEDLLGLGDELAVRLGPCAAAVLRRAATARPPGRAASSSRARPRRSSGSKGFTRYASAPRPRPFSRSRSELSVETMISGIARVGRVLLDERDQLEPVDVGHVDVGDDQVEGAAREQPQRLEAAARLGDLHRGLELLERRRDQRPHRRRVLDDEDALHGRLLAWPLRSRTLHRSARPIS